MIITEDSLPSLEAILNYSIFNSEKDLLAQFDAIPGKKGTRVLIWNMRRYCIPEVMYSNEQRWCDESHFHRSFGGRKVDKFLTQMPISLYTSL